MVPSSLEEVALRKTFLQERFVVYAPLLILTPLP
jgi:hypothetical protein